MKPPACFEDRDTRPIIEELCQKNKIDIQLLSELCNIIQNYSGSGRPEGIYSDIAGSIDTFIQREKINGNENVYLKSASA